MNNTMWDPYTETKELGLPSQNRLVKGGGWRKKLDRLSARGKPRAAGIGNKRGCLLPIPVSAVTTHQKRNRAFPRSSASGSGPHPLFGLTLSNCGTPFGPSSMASIHGTVVFSTLDLWPFLRDSGFQFEVDILVDVAGCPGCCFWIIRTNCHR
jgi:hypothetical protein